jgi:hypothetical protein
VQFENGEIVLRIGEFKVSVDSVVEIMAAEDDGATDDAVTSARAARAAEAEAAPLPSGLTRALGVLRYGPLSLL